MINKIGSSTSDLLNCYSQALEEFQKNSMSLDSKLFKTQVEQKNNPLYQAL